MRYLPLDKSEREAMLTRIGAPDIEALFADIPADQRIHGLLDMPLAKSEMAVERAMMTIANETKNSRDLKKLPISAPPEQALRPHIHHGDQKQERRNGPVGRRDEIGRDGFEIADDEGGYQRAGHTA